MSPSPKKKTNKDYCKRYGEKNRENYRMNDAERKRANRRLKIRLQNPDLYEVNKKEERERKQVARLRKKYAAFVNNSAAISETPTVTPEEPATSTSTSTNNDSATLSTSFSTKQSKARSISRDEKALPRSPRKKNEILGSFGKEISTSNLVEPKENWT